LGVQWQQTSIVHHVGQLLINTVTSKVKYEIKFVLFGFSGDHFRLIPQTLSIIRQTAAMILAE
jgi:hypothetical protein